MIDVTGNGPNELEAIQEGLHSLSDCLQVALGDDFELSIKSGEELHKVLGLSMLLAKLLVRSLEALNRVGVLGIIVFENLNARIMLINLNLSLGVFCNLNTGNELTLMIFLTFGMLSCW